MKKTTERETFELIHKLVKKVLDLLEEGKSLVPVDEKVLEQVDKQVEAGKYRNRSHAIEVLILKDIEKGHH